MIVNTSTRAAGPGRQAAESLPRFEIAKTFHTVILLKLIVAHWKLPRH